MRREFHARSIGVLLSGILGISFTSGVLVAIGTVFLVPLTQEFGWSRTAFSTMSLMVSTYLCVGVGFLAGMAADRWGVRRIMLPLACTFPFALGSLAFLNGSLVQGYLLFALTGPGAAIAVCIYKLNAAWFHRRLGMALALSGLVNTVMISVMPLFLQFLLDRVGWRNVFLVMAAIFLFAVIPFIALFAREPDEAARLTRKESASSQLQPGMDAKYALRTAAIWIILLGDFVASVASGGLRTHFVPISAARGLSAQDAVQILAIGGLAGILVRPFSGYLLDRIHSPKVILPFAAVVLAGMLLFIYSVYGGGTAVLLITAVVLLNMGAGGESGVGQYFLTRYYGRRHYGQLAGIVYLATPIGIGLGPVILGAIYDGTKSYYWALILLTAGLTLAAMLYACLGSYRYGGTDAQIAEGEENAAERIFS
jgi:MFS family permease